MSTPAPHRIDWTAVFVFFVLACAWSWPLFWLRDMVPGGWNLLPLPPPLRMTLLMWGPGLAALVCWRLFRGRVPRAVSLAGGRPGRALAFYAVPLLVLALIGVTPAGAPEGTRIHALVLAIAVVGFFNVLGEELGWRGFLQQALQPLGRLRRYSLIGALWAAWHFTNLFAGRDGEDLLRYLAWYLPTTVALAALLGEGVARSRALAVAVTLHAWVNLLWEFPGTTTLAIAGASLPYWAWLWWTWPVADAAPSVPGVQPHADAGGVVR